MSSLCLTHSFDICISLDCCCCCTKNTAIVLITLITKHPLALCRLFHAVERRQTLPFRHRKENMRNCTCTCTTVHGTWYDSMEVGFVWIEKNNENEDGVIGWFTDIGKLKRQKDNQPLIENYSSLSSLISNPYSAFSNYSALMLSHFHVLSK